MAPQVDSVFTLPWTMFTPGRKTDVETVTVGDGSARLWLSGLRVFVQIPGFTVIGQAYCPEPTVFLNLYD